ncbi:hypothetical protein GCM10023169_14080 [Georgenia halophila]|uniref:UTP--glucose-1-phosphate uridylyltransferase n=1 Tax=Georgenia halophila TaxID=620889 RepID=A0ABP8L465_9MICO
MPANATRSRARKAVVPAAGQGTRFAPATKAIPKEMLPLLDKPTIEYVVEEIAEAGPEKQGDAAGLAAVRRSSSLARLHHVRQGSAKGLGHAVLQGGRHVELSSTPDGGAPRPPAGP